MLYLVLKYYIVKSSDGLSVGDRSTYFLVVNKIKTLLKQILPLKNGVDGAEIPSGSTRDIGAAYTSTHD